jgi:trigger factor
LGKNAKIKGFRPGKVPRKVLEARFGHQVLERVREELIKESLPMAVEENIPFPLSLEVVEKRSFEAGQPLQYEAVVEMRPDFEVKDYLGVEVEKERYSVTDDDVTAAVERLRERRSKMIAIEEDRPIERGDYAVINYEGFEGDRPLEALKAVHFSLRVGSHDFHPEFEEALIGLRKGDTKEIGVGFNADHPQPTLAGKHYRFKVTLVDIEKRQLPGLDDAFARSVEEGVSDLGELREKIRQDIIREEEMRTDRECKQRLITKISDGVHIELPESLVETEIARAMENYRRELKRTAAGPEEGRVDEARLRVEFRPASEHRVKWMLVLGQIARQHDLSISDEELDKGFLELYRKVGQDVQVLRRFHEDNNMVDALRQSLLEEKVLDFLIEASVVKEVDADRLRQEADKKIEMEG